MFCKFKNIFGKPGEGIHKYRIFNIAIVDVVATVILGYIIHIINQKLKIFPKIKFWYILVALFILSIVAHRLFCVRTTIDKLLFPNA